ncbi:MAG: sulfatase-like hydrolase/transferase, partial [Planctomycetes bacterium]|nr:sulfatase-like hydrolase/transferase [Planctomycetota bacterium]
DIFFDAAIRFIEENRERPFFAYIPTNCPHTPYEVDGALVEPARARGLPEPVARSYAMTENIDANLGKLLAVLERLDIARDTIVIFLTDNGPDARRYTAGLRGNKGTVYEGGIRTAFFLRWPARIRPGTKVRRMAAHIDIAPTLLAACGVPRPAHVPFDGRNILPLLLGRDVDWPARTYFVQWHRGDVPEKFRACAAREERWKLVDGKELYDLAADPAEAKDVAADHPDVVARMRAAYETWFEDVSSTRGYDPPRIYVGTPHESPTTLTRQDWRGPRAGWGADSVGYWEIRVARAGTYAITLRFPNLARPAEAHLRIGGADLAQPVDRFCGACRFSGIKLPAGDARLEPWLAAGEKTTGVEYADVLRTAD